MNFNKYFKNISFVLAVSAGLTGQAFIAETTAADDGKERSKETPLLSCSGSGISSAFLAHSSSARETEIENLKETLKSSSGDKAVLDSRRLFEIAKSTDHVVERAGLLACVLVDGVVEDQNDAVNALTAILSGGDGDQKITLEVRLAAAKKAFIPAIDKHKRNSQISILPRLRRQVAASGQKTISERVVECFADIKTSPDLINLFNDAAKDLGGDETLRSEIARRVHG